MYQRLHPSASPIAGLRYKTIKPIKTKFARLQCRRVQGYHGEKYPQKRGKEKGGAEGGRRDRKRPKGTRDAGADLGRPVQTVHALEAIGQKVRSKEVMLV